MAVAIDPALSPYFQGGFAPVQDELDVADLVVTGEIPRALRGVYMRNGANQAFPPLGAYHVFDGDGMVHAVYLEDGTARYTSEGTTTLADRGSVEYVDYEGPEGKALSFERFDGGKWEAGLGESVALPAMRVYPAGSDRT